MKSPMIQKVLFILLAFLMLKSEVLLYGINPPLKKEGARCERFKTIHDTLHLHLYVFEPEGHSSLDSAPAIVFFHGGGWRKGKSTQFDMHGRYLASRGMVVIQADYRIMERDGVTPFECVMDGKAAIRWIRANAGKLGINPHFVAAGGGSAGGHIAAACGNIPGLEHPDEDLSISSKPDALVLFNPVFDNGPDGYRYDLFGDRYNEISPLHNIRPGAPPTLVFFGTEDRNVPVSTAIEYQHRMEEAGSRCDLKLYDGQGHGFFNLRKGGYEIYAQTVYEMDRFLISLGYLQGEPTIDLKQTDIEVQ